jgi:RNA polymerase sigma-70 factor (ECF subfamily)
MGNSDSQDLVARWREGEQEAATELFQRYASRLVALARSQLPAKLARRVDPEDVVQSVYRTFFADAADDRFLFQRGGDLWQLLVAITFHKLHDHIRRHRRDKRATDRDRGFGSEDSLFAMQAHLSSREPAPVEALALLEQVEQVMRRLRPLSRRILELRLQGYNLEEIARATRRSQRSVIRDLNEIRSCLEEWHRETFGP